MVWVGRDISGNVVQTYCNKQGDLQLDQAAQSPVPPDLERFLGRSIHHLPEQPATSILPPYNPYLSKSPNASPPAEALPHLQTSYNDLHSPHQLLHFVIYVQVLLGSLEAVGPLGQAVGQGVAGGRHLPVEGGQPLVTLPPILIRSARLWGGVVTVARGRGHPGVLGLCGSRGRRGGRRDVVGAVAVGAASVAGSSPKFVAMLLVQTVQGFQGVQDLMPGHPRASQALQEVNLLYGESWLVCVVRHGFQQAGKEVKYKILQVNSSRWHTESTL